MISLVDEHYFDVMEIGLVAGRGFDGSEVAEGPLVGIVNQAFADEIFPGESVLGKRIRPQPRESGFVPGAEGQGAEVVIPETTIIGVARDVRHQGLHVPAEPKLYVPVLQNHRDADQWLLRVQGDPSAVMELARQAVTSVSPSTPVRGVEVLEERIASSVAVPRFRTLFVVGLAAMATILALLGVYGVVTFAVSQRTRELAVRMAIGAHPRELVTGTIRAGLELAVAGVLLGALIAVWANRLLTQFLYDVDPTDPLTYVFVASLVGTVAVGASWLPARRAARVDPVTVLNAE
jgi:hypothetical protein